MFGFLCSWFLANEDQKSAVQEPKHCLTCPISSANDFFQDCLMYFRIAVLSWSIKCSARENTMRELEMRRPMMTASETKCALGWKSLVFFSQSTVYEIMIRVADIRVSNIWVNYIPYTLVVSHPWAAWSTIFPLHYRSSDFTFQFVFVARPVQPRADASYSTTLHSCGKIN